MKRRARRWFDRTSGAAAERRTQVGLAGVAITHFQKACGEIGARQGIVGTQRQRMPVGIGGSGIFAVQQQDASELCQDFGAPRRSFASLRKDRARLAAVVAVEVQARKVQLQIDGFRRQCKSAFDDGDGLVDASGLGKLAGEFLEGRQKWRAPRRGPAQLFNRFRTASGAAQRRAKQGFDPRIAAAARCLFEGRDRLLSTVLSDQGLSQYRCGGGVGPARLSGLRRRAARPQRTAASRSARAARSSSWARRFPRLTEGKEGCFGMGSALSLHRWLITAANGGPGTVP